MCVSEREGKRQKKTEKEKEGAKERAETVKNGEDSLYSYDAQKQKNKTFLCVTTYCLSC